MEASLKSYLRKSVVREIYLLAGNFDDIIIVEDANTTQFIFGNYEIRLSADGTTTWFKNGLIHRDGDRPAIIHRFYKKWYRDGVIHRDGDRPAHIGKYDKCWYKDGRLHRDVGPAMIYHDENEWECAWYKYGRLHREDGPAYITSGGLEKWCDDGYVHRDGGPAIIERTRDWVIKTWIKKGIMERDDVSADEKSLPVIVRENYKDGELIRREEEWFSNGLLIKTRFIDGSENWYDKDERILVTIRVLPMSANYDDKSASFVPTLTP